MYMNTSEVIMSENEKIFIQIAAYRDPELYQTIRDCIKRADHPENLTFAIAWQHSKEDEWDTLGEYKDDPRFRIIDIPYEEGLGTCWARSLLNDQYAGEKYTLQLDSHHRFVKGWDTKCLNMFNALLESGVEKPLLTAYLPSYNPANDPAERTREAWKLDFDRFIPEGAIFMLPSNLENYRRYKLPVPTRFFSAHFAFTYGQFVKDVPYDPNLYFHGEEISMAVRAYTHGYDLFVPNDIVCWHEYTRKGRVRHWDENKKWEDLNNKSLKRVKILLDIDGDYDGTDFGKYGLGTVRPKEEYEKFAGIRFVDRAVQTYTKMNFDAPNPTYRTKEAYDASFKSISRHCLDVHHSVLPEKDYDCLVVAFFDEDENEIYRQDFDEEAYKQLETERLSRKDDNGEFYNIWIEFETKKRPYKWIVWPHSVSNGWCSIVENKLPYL